MEEEEEKNAEFNKKYKIGMVDNTPETFDEMTSHLDQKEKEILLEHLKRAEMGLAPKARG